MFKGKVVAKSFLLLFIFIFLLKNTLQAQESPEDSVKYPFAKPDTLRTIKIKSNLYWYDLEKELHTIKDSSHYKLFSIDQEIGLNYGDIGDIF